MIEQIRGSCPEDGFSAVEEDLLSGMGARSKRTFGQAPLIVSPGKDDHIRLMATGSR